MLFVVRLCHVLLGILLLSLVWVAQGCVVHISKEPLLPSFHHSVAVLPLPFPLAVAASIHCCGCGCHMPWLVSVNDCLASYGTTATEKIEHDPISTEEWLQQLFAVYSCNRTDFSYVIFTEQRNFTTVKRQRKNGNGMVETGHLSG